MLQHACGFALTNKGHDTSAAGLSGAECPAHGALHRAIRNPGGHRTTSVIKPASSAAFRLSRGVQRPQDADHATSNWHTKTMNFKPMRAAIFHLAASHSRCWPFTGYRRTRVSSRRGYSRVPSHASATPTAVMPNIIPIAAKCSAAKCSVSQSTSKSPVLRHARMRRLRRRVSRSIDMEVMSPKARRTAQAHLLGVTRTARRFATCDGGIAN